MGQKRGEERRGEKEGMVGRGRSIGEECGEGGDGRRVGRLRGLQGKCKLSKTTSKSPGGTFNDVQPKSKLPSL